jgi:enamine deaminase RidA (YjgF/YER057c/UK114 family)
MRILNPAGVAGPFASYSHGIEVPAGSRLVFGAGQTGVASDGRTGEGIEEQARLTWQNVTSVLAEAGLAISNIVHLNMLLVDRADQPAAMVIRDEFLGEHRPASTLMYVAGLARPEWLIEIDYIAAE